VTHIGEKMTIEEQVLIDLENLKIKKHEEEVKALKDAKMIEIEAASIDYNQKLEDCIIDESAIPVAVAAKEVLNQKIQEFQAIGQA
jgi:hypothetical protein